MYQKDGSRRKKGRIRVAKNMSDTEYYDFSEKKTYKRISSVNIFLISLSYRNVIRYISQIIKETLD